MITFRVCEEGVKVLDPDLVSGVTQNFEGKNAETFQQLVDLFLFLFILATEVVY